LIPDKESELSRLELISKIVVVQAESDARHGALVLSGASESSTVCKEFYSPEGVWSFPDHLYNYGSANRAQPPPPPNQSRGTDTLFVVVVMIFIGG
jgi:hypothetical protein